MHRLMQLQKTRRDMAEGCPEKIDIEFMKYIWNFPKNSRLRIVSRLENCADKNIIIFKSRSQVKRFYKRVEKKVCMMDGMPLV